MTPSAAIAETVGRQAIHVLGSDIQLLSSLLIELEQDADLIDDPEELFALLRRTLAQNRLLAFRVLRLLVMLESAHTPQPSRN